MRMDAHAIFKGEMSCKLHSMCLLHIKQGLVLSVNAVAVHLHSKLSFIHVCLDSFFFNTSPVVKHWIQVWCLHVTVLHLVFHPC